MILSINRSIQICKKKQKKVVHHEEVVPPQFLFASYHKHKRVQFDCIPFELDEKKGHNICDLSSFPRVACSLWAPTKKSGNSNLIRDQSMFMLFSQ